MFIGHYGVGFAAKKIDDKPSLGTMFIASQFIDLLFPIFLLLGWEQVKIEPGITSINPLNFVYYPYSHSFIGVFVWAVLFGAVYYLIRRNHKMSLLLSGLVFSHWFLDLIVHIPDLPIAPWSSMKFGFGVWNSFVFSVLIEGLIFAGGAYLYIKSTRAKNKTGIFALWGLIIFLAVIYVMNLVSAPPPNAEAIAYVGFSQWIIIAWAYWIDKNREAVIVKQPVEISPQV